MYVLPASHLKVHATIEKGLADEQTVFAGFFALGGPYFALCGVFFLQLHALADENCLIGSVVRGRKFGHKTY
jgi:hypothetical protein